MHSIWKNVAGFGLISAALVACATAPKQVQTTAPQPKLKPAPDLAQIQEWLELAPIPANGTWKWADSVRFVQSVWEEQILAQGAFEAGLIDSAFESRFKSQLDRALAETWRSHWYGSLGQSQESVLLARAADPALSAKFPAVFSTALAEAVWASGARLQSFYEANRDKWKKPNQYEVAVILALDSNAQKVRKALAKGQAFDSLARVFSVDPESAGAGGYLGWYFPGVDPGVLMPSGRWIYDTLMRMGAPSQGKIFERPPRGGTTAFVKVLRFRPEEVPPLDSVRAFAVEQFVAQSKQDFERQQRDSLFQAYGVSYPPLPYAPIDSFIASRPQQFTSPRAWKVRFVEAADSAQLALKLKGVDLAHFGSLITQLNQNKYARHGQMGWVKQGYGLPYDFGTLPAVLDAFAKQNQPGVVEGVFSHPQRSGFFAFAIDSVREPALKPTDRVRAWATLTQKAEPVQFAPQTPVVLWEGGVLARERDYQTLLKEIPMRMRKQYPRARLLEVLADLRVLARQAHAQGFDTSALWKSQAQNYRSLATANLYKDSVVMRNLGVSDSVVASRIKQNAALFAKVPLPKAQAAALYSQIPTPALALEQARHQDTAGSTATLAQDSVFVKIAVSQVTEAQTRAMQTLLGQYAPLPAPWDVYSPTQALASAKRARTAGAYDLAVDLMRRSLAFWPSTQGADSMRFEMALALSDLKRSQEAIQALDVIEFQFPQSTLRERALFTKGYLLMEELKKDSAALRPLRKLLADYPKGDLADDADFLIRDIQSGHKLTEEILRKLQGGNETQTQP